MLVSILVIIIIHSILKIISDSLGNSSTGQITYFIQFILIVTILMKAFGESLAYINKTVKYMTEFSFLIIPYMISIIAATGNIASASSIQTIILFFISFIGDFIVNIVIPILVLSTTIGIISNLSDKINIGKLSKYLKSGIVWCLSIVLTVFTAVLSLESTLSKGVDQVSVKATKAAVSGFVPVVGKILGDTVETVLGCAGIIKNTIGVIGVICIIGICILPIIRVGVLTITYYLTSGLCEVIADKKIVNILEQMGDTFKILFGIVTALCILMIIGITIVMKVNISS